MKLQSALAAAALLGTTLAMNPEDVVGIIADTIVPNPDLCQALCQQNERCIYSLYHLECDQCWQMDCSGAAYIFLAAVEYNKLTTKTTYLCDKSTLPKMPQDCGNLTATATITALDQAAPTGGSDDEDESAAGTREVSWVVLGAAVAAMAAAL